MADEVKSLKTRKKKQMKFVFSRWSPGSSVLPLCKMLTEVSLEEVEWVLWYAHF